MSTFLREGVRVLAQAVMEAEVTELTGVPKGERDPERRLTQRNGSRPALGHPGGDHEPVDPEGPRRVVLPLAETPRLHCYSWMQPGSSTLDSSCSQNQPRRRRAPVVEQ